MAYWNFWPFSLFTMFFLWQLKRWERKDCKPNSLPVLHKMHVKVGDTVKVISGRDKGKIGEISKVFRHNGTVVVKEINLKTKHMKSREEGEPGQIIKVEFPSQKLAVCQFISTITSYFQMLCSKWTVLKILIERATNWFSDWNKYPPISINENKSLEVFPLWLAEVILSFCSDFVIHRFIWFSAPFAYWIKSLLNSLNLAFQIEAPIHSSNVMLYSKEKEVASRVGHKILDNGKRVRYLIKTGEVIDSAENWKKLKEESKKTEVAAAASS